MKRLAIRLAQFFVWLVLTLVMTRLWLTHPLAPNLPQPMWRWFDELYGSTNAEEVADMELLFLFGLSGLTLALAGWAISRVIKRVRGRHPVR